MEMEFETHVPSGVAAADTRGKHRILAELKRLEQETRSLEHVYREINKAADHLSKLLPSSEFVEVIESSFAEDFKKILYDDKEELDELEKTDKVSVACKELLLHIEARPDPLLPVTNGPTNPLWDRWFEGPQDSQGCRCWRSINPLQEPNTLKR